LFTGEERMAVGANFDVDVSHRRARFGDISACTRDLSRLIFWMNSCLHDYLSVAKFYNISSGELQLALPETFRGTNHDHFD